MRPETLALSLVGSLALAGCALVAGTSDLEPCQGDACGGGGGGGGGSTASAPGTGGSTTTTTSTGPSCFDVTVLGQNGVRIRVDVPETDLTGASSMVCLPPGAIRLRAFCGDSGSDKVAVSWGNALCADGFDECLFDLQGPQTFTITGAVCPG